MTADDFASLLTESSLLEPGQAEELPSLWGEATDARGLARELLRRDWLTAYQVNQIFQGKAADLLVGPYLLLERGEADALGQVYKARHRMMRRLVSLRILDREHLADADAVDRFRREVQALAQISHPNVLAAHDAGEAHGTLYFATEYAAGVPLSELVRQQGPVPVPRACELIRQAAQGLQHAFERGFVHRDLKPANLLLAPGGTVKILHLGFSRLPPGAAASPPDPAAADYLAPEQGEGIEGADIRADIYSLGGILHFLLTGMPPFPGGSFHEKRVQQRSSGPPPLAALLPGVPPELERVVRRMMARRPEDRFQAPDEMVPLLEQLAHGGPGPGGVARTPGAPANRVLAPPRGAVIPAPVPAAFAAHPEDWQAEDPFEPPPRQPAAPPPWPPKKTVNVWAIAGWLMILTVGGAAAVALWPQEGSPFGRVEVKPPAGPPRKGRPGQTPKPKPPQPKPTKPQGPPSVLDGLRPTDVPAANRPTGALAGQVVAVLGPNPEAPASPVISLAFASDESLLLSAGGRLRLWDCVGGKELARFPTMTSARTVALSPEGKTALTIPDPAAGDSPVVVWNLKAGTSPGTLGEPGQKINRVGFLDETSAFTAGGDGVFRVWDVIERTEQRSRPLGFAPRDVALIPGGTEVIFLADGGQLRRWDWKAGKEVHAWDAGVNLLAVSPDGGRVYYGREDGGVGIYTGEPIDPLREEYVKWHSGAIVALSLSPDGKRLATADDTGVLLLWDTTADRLFRKVAEWQRPEKSVRSLNFAPDNRHLAAGNTDGTIFLVRWPEAGKDGE